MGCISQNCLRSYDAIIQNCRFQDIGSKVHNPFSQLSWDLEYFLPRLSKWFLNLCYFASPKLAKFFSYFSWIVNSMSIVIHLPCQLLGNPILYLSYRSIPIAYFKYFQVFFIILSQCLCQLIFFRLHSWIFLSVAFQFLYFGSFPFGSLALTKLGSSFARPKHT